MYLPSAFSENLALVRRRSPIIHNITNYVAMTPSANALLAIGASPVMSSEPQEADDIVSACDALVINTGCMEYNQISAMCIAARRAMKQRKPFVLDPAGFGLSKMRRANTKFLIRRFKPAVIRGNASEILALYGADTRVHGLDSGEDSASAVPCAVELARKYGTVVSLSGKTDYVTDGRRIISILNGSAMMPRVTAMGCTASALSAAFAAVESDSLVAAACAMALMGVAGEMAESMSAGTGSFAVNFMDALGTMNPVDASAKIRYEEKSA